MKLNIKHALLSVFIASSLLFLLGSNALAVSNEPGKIPEIGNLTGPSTTADITSNLGIFSAMGKFILEYAVQIAVFIMVLATVVLSIRGSWARSNNKVEDAAHAHKNTKGLLEDGIITMAALLFIFYILAPFVKSFIPA